MKKSKSSKEPKAIKHACEFCKREFALERTLFNHLCQYKYRWIERDKPSGRIGYGMWLNFYNKMSMSNKSREFADYIKSPYYAAFNRFANYCIDTHVINHQMFSDWLLKNNIPIDKWGTDSQYSKFLIDYLLLEDAYDAIKRTLGNMITIGEKHSCEYSDVFTKVHPNKICNAIMSGKISPWVLYKSESGVRWMSGLDNDQFSMISEYVDPQRWGQLFKDEQEKSADIASTLKEIEF